MFTALARLLRLSRAETLPSRVATTRRTSRRPRLEALEDRLACTVRMIVPLDVATDATHFHTLNQALLAPGLAANDVIEIEAGSSPGTFSLTGVPATQNLTIRGNASYAADDLPLVVGVAGLTVNSSFAGLVIDNLHLNLQQGISLSAQAKITRSHIEISGPAIAIAGANSVLLQNNVIAGINPGGPLIDVTVGAGSQNVIAGNRIISASAAVYVAYHGTGTIVDRIEGNTMIGAEGNSASPMVTVGQGVDGITIRNNDFRDRDFATNAISVSFGATHVTITGNRINLPQGGAVSPGLILFGSGNSGQTTSATISNNRLIASATGTAIYLSPFNGPFEAKVEGNTFLRSAIGIVWSPSGSPTANLDLGGGSLGSLGANNFRTFAAAATSTTGAIVVGSGTPAIDAHNNLFRVADPETVIFDAGDDGSRVNVDATNPLTDNRAYVEALYLQFVQRIGLLSVPSDAGKYVTMLNNSPTAATVANVVNQILKSDEARGVIVTNVYRRLFDRAPAPAALTSGVNFLKNGGTLEGLMASVLVSAEYTRLHDSNRQFVSALYVNLLARLPSSAELNAGLKVVATKGRKPLAATLLAGKEFRTLEVQKLFADVLKRPTTTPAAQVNPYINSKDDLLTITINLAKTSDFRLHG